ncbi:MAG: quinone-dependent dihydroorotate dehydrogenase [Sphingobacteriales bacterium]|nr:quinone-dependent dihydroorotate dehydrogenase [Sphingobacteriales bacterium]OJY91979.1 MAG: dihydroorotate dehydrogenase (quinone) [Sphingobacteriales bacterium 44-15]
MYALLRNILFLFPPEQVHYFSMNMLKGLCSIRLFRKAVRKYFRPADERLEVKMELQHGALVFSNPVGLGAGFDKNARYLRELEALGFGFVEIGTVTPRPQPGNDKPRLFRLPKDRALINRMGFNNDGVEAIAGRLKQWRNDPANKRSDLIIGGNIGKNKATANDDAWKDYVACFTALFDYVDYFVVNVSSPNTPGLRELQEKDALRKILVSLQEINDTKQSPKPVFLKIAPDLTPEQLDDVVDLALEIKLDGLVATNTTISRTGLVTAPQIVEAIGAGGLSGKPLQKRSTEVVQYIIQKAGGKLPVIASGGIFGGNDALEKIGTGAQLIQVWTGFIYRGPGIVKQICNTLSGERLPGGNRFNG